jgi:hypothetical protein
MGVEVLLWMFWCKLSSPSVLTNKRFKLVLKIRLVAIIGLHEKWKFIAFNITYIENVFLGNLDTFSKYVISPKIKINIKKSGFDHRKWP